MQPFCDTFFERSPEQVAPELLGWTLRHGSVALEIVETEAYLGPDDPASHAYGRKTARNASLFGPVGRAYIYLSYGMHLCFNVVCHPPDGAGGILIRAGSVVQGISTVRERRGRDKDLANGPGRLGQALALDLSLDGSCLREGPLRLLSPPVAIDPALVSRGPRVGISRAVERPLRFWLSHSSDVSRHRRTLS